MPAITYTSFNFDNATLLTYQHSNNFLGDGTARLSSTKEISIEVLLRDTTIDDGVSQNWDTFISQLAAGSKNYAESITINGHAFGKGTISSMEMVEDNPVRVGYYRVNVSIPVEGNISFLDSEANSYYTNFSSSLLEDSSLSQYLRDIQENFSVDIDEEDKLSQTHSVTVQFIGEIGEIDTGITAANKAVDKAREVAENLFNVTNAPSIGFIHQKAQTAANATFQAHKSKKHYFTESYNLLNKSCTFTKVYETDQNEDDYSLKIRTTLILNADGTTSVTERGDIKGESFEQAQDAVETEIGNSAARCEAAYDRYKGDFFGDEYGGPQPRDGVSPVANLSTQPTEVGKEYTKKSKKASYNITYSNDPNLLSGHKHTYSVEMNQDTTGKHTVRVSGDVRPYKPVGVDAAHPGTHSSGGLVQKLIAAITGANTKAGSVYVTEANLVDLEGGSIAASASYLKQVRCDYNFPNNSLTGTYTKEFTDDVSLRYVDPATGLGPGEGSSTFKKMGVGVSDNLPIAIRNSYVIPNKKDQYQLIHEPLDGYGAQTNMGQRTITINSIIARPTTNVFSTIPAIDTELDKCKKIAAQRMADVIGDFRLDPNKTLVYVDSCQYNLDSAMNLSFTLTCNYTTARDAASVANMGIITG